MKHEQERAFTAPGELDIMTERRVVQRRQAPAVDRNAALSAAPVAQPSAQTTVPKGLKLVPLEPTDDMVVAFAEAWFMKLRCIDDVEMSDAYAAMLAAAPSQEPSAQTSVPTVAWLIEWTGPDGTKYSEIARHNSVADYLYVDEDATATELVRRIAQSGEARPTANGADGQKGGA